MCERDHQGRGKVLGPPTEIAEVGYAQYCHDVEGNVFAILESTAEEPAEDEGEEEAAQ